ncbi:response regulator transcription factor [Paraflavisolibacter sp. H34]|uniref:response regulator transcription factor n=1 Tax=Huijunlia imazamoxiresistens TaxID=3127457 RepID=UPI003016D5FE
MRLLIVEDELELAANIFSYMENESFTCELAATCSEALEKIGKSTYDCIVLDLSLPDGSGFHLLQELKKSRLSDGVIITSARNGIEDRVDGLHQGADDYLVKPYHLSELAARIQAITRRKQPAAGSLVRFREISIDTLLQQAHVRQAALDLTRKEYELLLFLLSNQQRVLSKNALVGHLWPDEPDNGETYDIVYTHIKNLRRKLQDKGCPDYIRSVYGIGYKLTEA